MTTDADRAIAIVGVGAMLPDAPSAPAFWNNIVSKRYSISEVPPERWNIADYYDPDPSVPYKSYSKIGGWVRDFEFDWKRFRIPPKVAAAMDEGQQWAVTIAAEALADFGYPDRPINTDRTGVILGTAMGGERHYITAMAVNHPEFMHLLEETPEFQAMPAARREAMLAQWKEGIHKHFPDVTEDTMPGELPNIVSGRVANVLNLRGPNFITDAACASSFAAINAAFEMLTEHHVDAVIAGGVDRNMGAAIFVKFCKIGALSATGSRPFGEGADGFVMGEGSGAFLLKRLADAERDGDKIYAVIRGVGGSSDGKGKGITAPNPDGQVLAVYRAWENAGLDPATATMVEAHGTSTKVGDVVEAQTLASVFKGAPNQSIALGSAKGNIGHLKAGAGAAGLLKTTMALYNKVLPPTLNAERPNPNFDFAHSPFYINTELREWEKANGTPRRAGVSAYGFGGTNFHLVLEEHIPGMLSRTGKLHAGVDIDRSNKAESFMSKPQTPGQPAAKAPIRGILAIGADSPNALKNQLDDIFRQTEAGWTPPVAPPDPAVLACMERLIIDFGDHDELLEKVAKARKAAGFDNPQAWKALQAQGIFRGSGPKPGKIGFLFPGQGSQYINMGRQLAAMEPAVRKVFAEADQVMMPILGKPLTDFIFVDSDDPAAMKQAEMGLMQTAITQPAMLTMDTALYKLLGEYGFAPDIVMGHSLGEYGALIAAGIMPFAHALEASAARGAEMTKVSMDDNGWMAAVMAPLEVVQATLAEVDGYVVAANINSTNQAVVGGASKAVERAIALFVQQGFQAMRIPVSHAFHTKIVAPASKPLRVVLDRLSISEPTLPLVANVTGELYPTTIESIKDILELQIASPVQWVKGLETMYDQGVRAFVEVGPKKALKGFVDDVLGKEEGVWSIFTNHPKTGELPTFNHALCGLYAAGYGLPAAKPVTVQAMEHTRQVAATAPDMPAIDEEPTMVTRNGSASTNDLLQVLQQLTNVAQQEPRSRRFDRHDEPAGSVVITGTGLGLPGANKAVMDPDNAMRILNGEQFVDLIPERFRKEMAGKRITRLVKGADGSGRFEVIEETDDVIKLAGRPGSFDLAAEYGVASKLVEALDITTQLSIAAGIDALREAGIPLVQTYRTTSKGTYLPEKWMLPQALRDETGVIFASAFPGGDRFVEEFKRFYTWQNRREQIAALEDLRQYTNDGETMAEIQRRVGALREEVTSEPYEFDRRFLFRILAMGHSQFAEYIGARGPNTHVNAACASTAQAVTMAEDWVRNGRCRRVVVVSADDVTDDNLMGWVGSGFLATGAAATDDKVDEAALPFDRRRHGTLLGMGACALVIESEDAVHERGMRGIVELLSAETANSAFHGTRLDVEHISDVMNRLVTSAERRFGLNRYSMASQTVFVSHETYTPARGGSAAAEVTALRNTFGDAATDIVMANTKGFTGHPMGAGVEDVIAVKILEYGIVPPVPNYREPDPDLGILNLSRGGRYPVQYAVHLAAGFGSQISMTLIRRIPGSPDRVDNKPAYQRWLDDVSGLDNVELETVKRTLRIKATGQPGRTPVASNWQSGTGPAVRATAPGGGIIDARPPRMVMPAVREAAPVPQAPATPSTQPPRQTPPTPAPAPVKPAAIVPPLPDVEEAIAPEPAVTEPVVVETEPAPDYDPIVGQVLDVVAQKTGYPSDMLDLELDMEADLGIDTVKQAETFAAIRETFGIPVQEGLSLRDYPSLGHVVNFVRTMRPDLAAATVDHVSQSADTPVAEPAASSQPPAAGDGITATVLAVVAEKTGYPQDMLDPELDMEADLGIDTVKQAETFTSIRESFGIPVQEGLSLRDYPTLQSVIEFVKTMRPDLATAATPDAAATPLTAEPSVPSQPSPAGDEISATVLAVVAEKTGYPQDMLDPELDMEADLGIDTVKQAETFTSIRESFAIPVQEGLTLRDYPTLQSVIDFVKTMRPDLAAATAAPAALPQTAVAVAPEPVVAAQPSSGSDEISATVLAVVAEKTGYPEDMLELDLDMEADLGIDTVKQAETFASIRESFGIPVQEGLSLRDYPTLQSVIDFVKTMRPDLAATTATAAPSAPAAPEPVVGAQTSPDGDEISATVLAVVAEKTGYPEDMLELDLDMEADLGIDTVKQAETFASIRESFGIPVQEGLSLRDYPTLQSVIDFVKTMRPDLAASTAAPAAPEPVVGAQTSPGSDEISATVLAVVAEKTGYPEDMLELDLDMEADLGIDTVKQAETFASIRESFAIPVQEGLSLRDYPTLQSVIDFVKNMRPDLAAAAAGAPSRTQEDAAPAPAVDRPSSGAGTPTSTVAIRSIGTLEDADKMPRRVPTPALRPAIDLCKPTGITLDEESRVVVMLDQGGVGKSLVNRLEKRGATALTVEPGIATDALVTQLEIWLADGPIQGVYWLAALDVEVPIEEMVLEDWRELNRLRVKNLYATMRALYDSVAGPGRFLLSATRLGGLHGYGNDVATAPLGGGVTGFTKSYNVEQGMREEGKGVLVKAVDFQVSRKTAEPADLLIAETLYDAGIVEVGYRDGLRYTVTLTEQPATDGRPGMVLDGETVFVVTGAAGGITSAIVTDLALASKGVFYLLDLVDAPPRNDPNIALFRNDKDGLKRKLIDEAKARGERPTPVVIDKQIMAIERSEAALRAIETVEAAGGVPHYFSVNLMDGDAVATIVDEIRERYGKIDVLLHAGGLLIDRVLPDKEPQQFNLVFDVKADGFFSLIRAAKGMPIGATVSFSSVAGRFGNNGQSDYASANDLLCKISSSMRSWRPETRGIAIDWTAWGEIGMASRGSVPTIMAALGIDMLPPEAGVPTIRRELTYGGTRGEVLVAGRLGAWTEEKDPAGGLDTAKVNAMLAEREGSLVMLGEVKAAKLYGGLVVETTLDPTVQPFLFDHKVEPDLPWLPGVMGSEAMAEAAQLLAPDHRVVEILEQQNLGALKFHRNEPKTLRLTVNLVPGDNGDLLGHAVVQSIFQPPKPELPQQIKDHFSATIRLTQQTADQPADQPVVDFTPPPLEELSISRDEVYADFFHGPAYQVIAAAKIDGADAVSLMSDDLGPNAAPPDAAELTYPRLFEHLVQSAALWSTTTKGKMALPAGYASATIHRSPDTTGGKRLYALVNTPDGGETYDAKIVDEAGNVYVVLNGYRTVSLM